MHYPEHLLKLIAVFKKLPGVGAKSAERFAFHLLDWKEDKLQEMSQVIELTKQNLKNCSECGCLVECTPCHSPSLEDMVLQEKCPFCQNPERRPDIFCVVASSKDVFSIEQTREFHGLYHVLGGLLSPLQGLSPAPHAIEKLKERAIKLGVKEMILALDSTLEGDATALYLKKELESFKISISRLALGLPMGSSLDFIDGGTLARALAGRHTY